MRERWLPIVVSVLMVGAVASPVLKNPNKDGFPLSTYPMFGWKRSTTITMEYMVGFTADGKRWHAPPRAIGTGEPMQAKRLLENARRGGKPGQLAMCEQAAKRTVRLRKDIVLMTMMTGTHEAVSYLVYDTPGTERELVRCPVPGREAEANAMPANLARTGKPQPGKPPPALVPGPAPADTPSGPAAGEELQ